MLPIPVLVQTLFAQVYILLVTLTVKCRITIMNDHKGLNMFCIRSGLLFLVLLLSGHVVIPLQSAQAFGPGLNECPSGLPPSGACRPGATCHLQQEIRDDGLEECMQKIACRANEVSIGQYLPHYSYTFRRWNCDNTGMWERVDCFTSIYEQECTTVLSGILLCQTTDSPPKWKFDVFNIKEIKTTRDETLEGLCGEGPLV